MEYKELSADSRKHVWKTFVDASTGNGGNMHAFTDADLTRLDAHAMNGREIKNMLKTAQLLASQKGVLLAAEHVESILAIEQRYIN